MEHTRESKNCQNCKKEFFIEPEDFLFYEKMQVPAPTFCPECRLIRRLIMRNERTLYRRKCDMCNNDKILVYPQDSKFKVYCRECFNSDNWDAIDYSENFDFEKNFLSQYISLYNSVPRVGIIKQGFSIDSEYTNRATDLKNCYLIFASAYSENCLYSMFIWEAKDSSDCFSVEKSERCFSCIDCYVCNNVKYSKDCNSCIDSYFLKNCRNCQNCFCCVNLRNKNYCIFNEQYTKEEYLKKVNNFNLANSDEIKKIKETFNNFSYNFPNLYMESYHSDDVSGNWINNSKNTKDSFTCNNIENGKYLFNIKESKDVMDYTYWGKGSELMYECNSVGIQCSNIMFSSESWGNLMNSEYCHNCFSSSNLFGCVGLKNKQYCILNKQYTKEEYQELVPKIKQQMLDKPFMDNVGRIIKYGEFFPSDMTPFAYNETIAQEYFPKTKEQAIKEGYRWKDIDKKNHVPTMMGDNLPKTINEVNDEIVNEVIGCIHGGDCSHQCTVAFKITPDELQFYRTNDIPLPELCPNCRHYDRLSNRNPIKLWNRKCMNEGCLNEFETTYSPDRKEIVYCKQCYQNIVN
jgi:hypothetical protein